MHLCAAACLINAVISSVEPSARLSRSFSTSLLWSVVCDAKSTSSKFRKYTHKASACTLSKFKWSNTTSNTSNAADTTFIIHKYLLNEDHTPRLCRTCRQMFSVFWCRWVGSSTHQCPSHTPYYVFVCTTAWAGQSNPQEAPGLWPLAPLANYPISCNWAMK